MTGLFKTMTVNLRMNLTRKDKGMTMTMTRERVQMKTIMRSLCLAAVMCIMAPAMALACTSPTGVEGEQVYNSTHNVMQYCDGTDWVAMNSIDAQGSITTLNSSLSALTTTVGEKVAKGGDTMTGLLALSGAPTANEHAATKEYVDTVAASSSGGAGRYQISCTTYDGGTYNQGMSCIMLDTQTGATKCQYTHRVTNNNWSDCYGDMNITSLQGTGIASTGGSGVYAANAYAWGQGNHVADGDNNNNNTPSQIDLNLAFTKVMGGQEAACGLASGKPYCWGSADSNGYGYKGNASGYGSNNWTPAALDLASIGYPVVNDIVYGRSGGMFKTATGVWYGFGRTYSTQVNYDSLVSSGISLSIARWRSTSSSGVNLPTDFTKFSLGTEHACGLRSNGNVHCAVIGNNNSNDISVLGNGSGTSSSCNTIAGSYGYNPSYMRMLREQCFASGGHTFTDVAIGGGSSYKSVCAVANDGKVYCWGYNNSRGQLGTGSTASGTGNPVAVDVSHLSPAPTFEKVYGNYASTNYAYYCALDTSGKAYCWGDNSAGQLGTGDSSYRTRPTPVLGGYNFSELSIGQEHTCGVTTEGLAYCWGNGGSGQLGYGASNSKLIPEPVSGAADFVGIGTSTYHTFGWK